MGLVEGPGGLGQGGAAATLGEDSRDVERKYEEYGYNAQLSDRISLDRSIPDYRPKKYVCLCFCSFYVMYILLPATALHLFLSPCGWLCSLQKKTCFRFGWLYLFTAWNVRQNLHYHWVHCAFILIHFFYLFIYVLLILCDIYCAKLKQTTMQLVLELINCTNIAWTWGLVDFARASCRFRWGQKCREQSCLCNTFFKSESHMCMCSYFYIFSFSCMQQ